MVSDLALLAKENMVHDANDLESRALTFLLCFVTVAATGMSLFITVKYSLPPWVTAKAMSFFCCFKHLKGSDADMSPDLTSDGSDVAENGSAKAGANHAWLLAADSVHVVVGAHNGSTKSVAPECPLPSPRSDTTEPAHPGDSRSKGGVGSPQGDEHAEALVLEMVQPVQNAGTVGTAERVDFLGGAAAPPAKPPDVDAPDAQQ